MYSFDKAAHVHAYDEKPLIGTTTALEVLSKPLTYWASGLACAQFGWMNPKPSGKPAPAKEEVYALAQRGHDYVKSLDLDGYVKHLDKAYRAHKTTLDKAADKGTDLHAEGEQYVKYCIEKNGGSPVTTLPFKVDERLIPFILWSVNNVRRFLWSEMNCYSLKMWVGGISDFGFIDNLDKVAIGDFKSSKAAYLSHYLQAGAYDKQIAENGGFTATGDKVFELPRPIDYYAIFCFGEKFEKPACIYNPEDFRIGFVNALGLYKLKKAFEGED